MKLTNQTMLSANAFRQFDAEGGYDCVVAASGTFVHRQDDTPAFAEVQEGFAWEDVYDGDPQTGVQLRQTDLVPGKPGTDVTFLGNAHAPGGRPARSIDCSIRIDGRLDKRFRAHGPRFWEPRYRREKKPLFGRGKEPEFSGWALTESEPAISMPVTWALAFGGCLPVQENAPADAHRHNPLGCGIPPKRPASTDDRIPAPRIEAANDPILASDRDYRPEGVGPISPWWRQRQQYAGTYDEAWLATRHPLLPRDFDARFWQCADTDLVASPHLLGGEVYTLTNLHALHPVARGMLPDVRLGVHCLVDGEAEGCDAWFLLALDGVHFDFRNDKETITLTWRARFPLPHAEGAELTLRRVTLASDDADEAGAAGGMPRETVR